jgi:hypothetical protein
VTKGVEPVKNSKQLLFGLFYGGFKFAEAYQSGVITKGSLDATGKFRVEE